MNVSNKSIIVNNCKNYFSTLLHHEQPVVLSEWVITFGTIIIIIIITITIIIIIHSLEFFTSA